MELIETGIEGLFILEPKVFGDSRGHFFESYSRRDFRRLTGLDIEFVQDNQSCSVKGVLRGLHFQKGDAAQAKLVSVVEGEVLDVAVDLREGSRTFGKCCSVILSGENKRRFFIPRGFAHGFSVLSDRAVFQYKCDNYYDPQSEGAVAWNDPDLAIDWKIRPGEEILSAKDAAHPTMRELYPDWKP